MCRNITLDLQRQTYGNVSQSASPPLAAPREVFTEMDKFPHLRRPHAHRLEPRPIVGAEAQMMRSATSLSENLNLGFSAGPMQPPGFSERNLACLRQSGRRPRKARVKLFLDVPPRESRCSDPKFVAALFRRYRVKSNCMAYIIGGSVCPTRRDYLPPTQDIRSGNNLAPHR